MTVERKESERSDIFLVVEFRQRKKTKEYSLGVMNNFSPDGFTLESQRFDLKPGEILELKLKHPRRDLSVFVLGETVWKKEAWYKCMMGIKFKEMDEETRRNLSELISNVRDMPLDSVINDKIEKAITKNKEEKPTAELNTRRQEEPAPVTFQEDDKDIYEYGEISGTEDVSVDKVVDAEPEKKNEIPAAEDPSIISNELRRPVEEADHVKEAAKNLKEKEIVHENVHKQTSDVKINGPQQIKTKPNMNQKAFRNDTVSVKRQRGKSWTYMLLVAILAVIPAVIFFINFENIAKVLIPYIPKAQSIFSLFTDKLQTVSFRDNARSDTMPGQLEHSTATDINNQDINKKEPLLIAEDAQSRSPGLQELDKSLPTQKTLKKRKQEIIKAKQLPAQKDTAGDKKYFIQVGTWKNSDYANTVLAQLQKDYPETYIALENNFKLIIIPNVPTKKRGDIISKKIGKELGLEPTVISIDKKPKPDKKEMYITELLAPPHAKQPVTESAIDQHTRQRGTSVVARDAQSRNLTMKKDKLPSESLKGNITFDTNSDVVTPEFYSEIERIAKALRTYPQTLIRVEGHTDNTGLESYNMDLSIRRATEVKNLLIQRGVTSSRMETKGFGHSSPVASNDTELGRSRNRRVEITMVN